MKDTCGEDMKMQYGMHKNLDHVLVIEQEDDFGRVWNNGIIPHLIEYLKEKKVLFSSKQVKMLHIFFRHESIHHAIFELFYKKTCIEKYAFGIIRDRKKLCPIKFIHIKYGIWHEIENDQLDYIVEKINEFIHLLFDIIYQLFIIPHSFKAKMRGFIHCIKEFLRDLKT